MSVVKQQLHIYEKFLSGFRAMPGTELPAHLADLHDFMNKLPVGIWKQGVDKKFEWANIAFSRITGYGLEELVRMETMEMVTPSWRQYVIARNKQMLAGEITGECFFPARMKDGKKLIVMGTIQKVGNSLYGGYITPVHVDQEKEPVSGLLNEISFYREMGRIIKACAQNPANCFVLMHIVVDRCERYLEEIGQFRIDEYIKMLGDRIDVLKGKENFGARISDSYFNILFKGPLLNSHIDIAEQLVEFSRKETASRYNAQITLSIALLKYDHVNYGMDAAKKFIADGYRMANRIQLRGGNDYFPKNL